MYLSHSDIDYIVQLVDDALYLKLRPYLNDNFFLVLSDEIEDEVKNSLRESITRE